jgi:hypothetical protein
VISLEAIEYLQSWQSKEFHKLRKRLAEEDKREANRPASMAPLPADTDEQRQAKLAALGHVPTFYNQPQNFDQGRGSDEVQSGGDQHYNGRGGEHHMQYHNHHGQDVDQQASN